MLHSLRHYGETNSFGIILRAVGAVGWRERHMNIEGLRSRCPPARTVSSTQGQGGT